MIAVLYSVVIFIATLLGAIAGLGGGVIIKPALDIIGYHDVSTISFLSSCAVFSMAVYSGIKQWRNGVQFEWKMIFCVGIGAVVGGNVGSQLFSYFLSLISGNYVKVIQAIILAILLIMTVIVVKKNIQMIVHGIHMYMMIGFLLGVISSFLGIGGGPINVAVFMMFFGIDMKRATIFSIITILFSQASKLLTIATTTGFLVYDCSLLYFVIPSALLGGIVGSYLNKILGEKQIERIFSMAIVCIIFMNTLIVVKNF